MRIVNGGVCADKEGFSAWRRGRKPPPRRLLGPFRATCPVALAAGVPRSRVGRGGGGRGGGGRIRGGRGRGIAGPRPVRRGVRRGIPRGVRRGTLRGGRPGGRRTVRRRGVRGAGRHRAVRG